MDPGFVGFANIVLVEGSGLLEGSQSGSCVGGCSLMGSWTGVVVWKLAWEEVSCTRDVMGMFCRDFRLPLAVSLGRVYTCGFSVQRLRSIGDLGF